MSKKSFIDSVKVGSACGESWEQMEGNDKVRFCSHCSKNVNNLSEMTRKEAFRFVRASDGNICIRYSTHPVTKGPLFAGELLQITRKSSGIAASVLSASIALGAQTYAQSKPLDPNTAWPGGVVQATGTSTVKKAETSQSSMASNSSISGSVVDPNGAVIPGIKVQVVGPNGSYTTVTDQDGSYRLEVAPGDYDITIDAQSGFTKLELRHVEINAETAKTLSLNVGVMAMGGAMVMVEYSSPLSSAIADEDVDLVRELLAKGAKVNAKEEDYNKITPLFVAVETGNTDIVQMLLAHGARPNARDDSKQTPIWRLDEDATPELVSVLLRAGAKANLTDDEGRTALIHLARRVTPEVLQALIDAGADINHADNEGTTALIAAADSEELENVRTLLIAGASVNAKDNEGKTAFEHVESEEIQKLLLSYGAIGKIKTEPKPDDEN